MEREWNVEESTCICSEGTAEVFSKAAYDDDDDDDDAYAFGKPNIWWLQEHDSIGLECKMFELIARVSIVH